jgi:hypothetical protein
MHVNGTWVRASGFIRWVVKTKTELTTWPASQLLEVRLVLCNCLRIDGVLLALCLAVSWDSKVIPVKFWSMPFLLHYIQGEKSRLYSASMSRVPWWLKCITNQQKRRKPKMSRPNVWSTSAAAIVAQAIS